MKQAIRVYAEIALDHTGAGGPQEVAESSLQMVMAQFAGTSGMRARKLRVTCQGVAAEYNHSISREEPRDIALVQSPAA